ncbi:MAG: hypothetical protein ACXADD_19395, partial [Candidatus Thorarchaeota archaeon]
SKNVDLAPIIVRKVRECYDSDFNYLNLAKDAIDYNRNLALSVKDLFLDLDLSEEERRELDSYLEEVL